MPANISKVAKEFGENIPKSFLFEDDYFITHIFCVDVNVNIQEICNKYEL